MTDLATTVQPVTYGDIIRRYSDNVAKGWADTDLNPRQRRLVVVMLNLASNNVMSIPYASLRDDDRKAAVKRLSDIMWDAGSLILAVSPRAYDDKVVAHRRANDVLRGV